MPDFREMYVTLFRETTKAIDILQAAQQKTEEIYISSDPSDNLRLLRPEEDEEDLKENPCNDDNEPNE